MKKCVFILSTLLTMFFMSCGQKNIQKKPSHEEKVELYILLTSTEKSHTTSWNEAMKAFNKLPWYTNNTLGEPMDDSLTGPVIILSKKQIHIADSCIRVLNPIQEIDFELKPVLNMKKLLAGSKHMWTYLVPKSVELYKKGVKNLNSYEKSQMSKYNKGIHEVVTQGQSIQYDFGLFLKHHNITQNELVDRGITEVY